MRLERPTRLDLPAIADGVIKNNMGLGRIELRVRGRLADGKVTLIETGQVLPVSGGPPQSTAPWLWLEARDFGLDLADALVWIGETALPAPVAAPR